MRVVKMLLAVVSVFTILVCCASGSLAWLTASSAPSVSEFSVGKIDVTLTDDTNNTAAVLIPGTNIVRDPYVTVKGGSVDCWLFVRVDAANGAGTASYGRLPRDGASLKALLKRSITERSQLRRTIKRSKLSRTARSP